MPAIYWEREVSVEYVGFVMCIQPAFSRHMGQRFNVYGCVSMHVMRCNVQYPRLLVFEGEGASVQRRDAYVLMVDLGFRQRIDVGGKRGMFEIICQALK